MTRDAKAITYLLASRMFSGPMAERLVIEAIKLRRDVEVVKLLLELGRIQQAINLKVEEARPVIAKYLASIGLANKAFEIYSGPETVEGLFRAGMLDEILKTGQVETIGYYIASIDPSWAEELGLLAEASYVYAEEGELDEALSIALYLDDEELYANLSEEFLKRGEVELAEELAAKAREETALLEVAKKWVELGEVERAKRLVASLSETSREIIDMLVHARRGEVEKIVNLYSSSPDLALELLIKMGRVDEAIRVFTNLGGDENGFVTYSFAKALSYKFNFESSYALLRGLINDREDLSLALSYLFDGYLEQEMFEEASKVLEKMDFMLRDRKRAELIAAMATYDVNEALRRLKELVCWGSKREAYIFMVENMSNKGMDVSKVIRKARVEGFEIDDEVYYFIKGLAVRNPILGFRAAKEIMVPGWRLIVMATAARKTSKIVDREFELVQNVIRRVEIEKSLREWRETLPKRAEKVN